MIREETNVIRRKTGLLVIEVRNSNPNGDPDRESDPRYRAHDQRGMISAVSFKRKLRDLVAEKEGPVWRAVSDQLGIGDGDFGEFEILESRGRERKGIEAEIKDGSFIRKYWDARLFGNTFLEKEGPDAMRTGVAQFALGLSVAPIRIERMTNTNKAGVQEGKDRGMAPLAYRVVQHGVYTMPFFVNPTAALKSGCTRRDIELMLSLIPYAYPHTASYVRPSVSVRHAWCVEHKSALGSCNDFALVDALTPKKNGDANRPSESWDDYQVPTGLGDLRSRVADLRDLMAAE